MKSFQKGLLLGIVMVVACGTFVASTSSEKDTYTIVKTKGDKVVFMYYEKDKEGEYKNIKYRLKSSQTLHRGYGTTDLYKYEDLELDYKNGVSMEKKLYIAEDCIEVVKAHEDKSKKDEKYYVNSKGEKIELDITEVFNNKYGWIDANEYDDEWRFE
jgi:hypothetical protein